MLAADAIGGDLRLVAGCRVSGHQSTGESAAFAPGAEVGAHIGVDGGVPKKSRAQSSASSTSRWRSERRTERHHRPTVEAWLVVDVPDDARR